MILNAFLFRIESTFPGLAPARAIYPSAQETWRRKQEQWSSVHEVHKLFGGTRHRRCPEVSIPEDRGPHQIGSKEIWRRGGTEMPNGKWHRPSRGGRSARQHKCRKTWYVGGASHPGGCNSNFKRSCCHPGDILVLFVVLYVQDQSSAITTSKMA